MDGASFFLRVGRRTVEQLAAAVKNCHFQPQGIADGGDKTFNERADHFQVCHKTDSFPKGQWREIVENHYKWQKWHKLTSDDIIVTGDIEET